MREDGMGCAARRLAVTFKLAVVRGWSLRVIELQVAKSASPKYGKAHGCTREQTAFPALSSHPFNYVVQMIWSRMTTARRPPVDLISFPIHPS